MRSPVPSGSGGSGSDWFAPEAAFRTAGRQKAPSLRFQQAGGYTQLHAVFHSGPECAIGNYNLAFVGAWLAPQLHIIFRNVTKVGDLVEWWLAHLRDDEALDAEEITALFVEAVELVKPLTWPCNTFRRPFQTRGHPLHLKTTPPQSNSHRSRTVRNRDRELLAGGPHRSRQDIYLVVLPNRKIGVRSTLLSL